MAELSPEAVLERVAGIRRYARDGFVAPNKPVTLLWALARLEEGEPRLTPFSLFEEEVRPLLVAAGRPRTLPVHAFWALRTDDLWEVVTEGELEWRSGSQEPTTTSLREANASGGFNEPTFIALTESSSLREAVSSVLREQLRESTSSAIHVLPAAGARQTVERLVRDAAFRQGVMAAYGGRCVVCGWSSRHRGKPVALAAAHVHPLEHNGPDVAGNGIVLCFHHHALFDAGLFAYDEQRRLVVSSSWQEEERGSMPSLLDYAGTVLPEPSDPAWSVRDRHLHWHRENVFGGQLGGVPSTIAQ
ncbi:MAG: phosphorothioated DNA-binding restriction endonuclease [Solirubrobacterales bacterium]